MNLASGTLEPIIHLVEKELKLKFYFVVSRSVFVIILIRIRKMVYSRYQKWGLLVEFLSSN